MPERIAISAGTIVPMNSPIVRNGTVIISDGRIEKILSASEAPSKCDRENYPSGILLPAFVNPHTHIALSAFRGLADDKSFALWLKEIISLDLHLRTDECRDGAKLGIAQCFRNGITAIGDNHYLSFARDAMIQYGMKGVNFLELFGVRTSNLSGALIRHDEDIDEFVNTSTDRNRIGLAPHAPYSVPPSVAKLAAEKSREYGIPLSLHCAESRDEIILFTRGDGLFRAVSRFSKLPLPDRTKTPLMYFAENGLLTDRTMVVHGVHLSDYDLNLIASSGSTLVSCPTSNAKLGCGTARTGVWKRKGIPISIGTDSPASGDGYDMFEEMRRFVLFQRSLSQDTGDFTSEDILKMTTVNPAKALGMSHLVGDLREGSCADMILVEPDMSGVSRNRDIYQHILWGTKQSDIVKVWADGKEVYRR